MTLKKLVKLVNFHTGLDLISNSREVKVVMARAIYYKLAYSVLRLGSLERVGSEINKNYATVLYSLKNHWTFMEKDFPEMYTIYNVIIDSINNDIDGVFDFCNEVGKLHLSVNKLKLKNFKLESEVESLKSKINTISESKGHPVLDEIIHSIMSVQPCNFALLKFRLTSVINGL